MKLFKVKLLVNDIFFWKSKNKYLFLNPPLNPLRGGETHPYTPPKGGDL